MCPLWPFHLVLMYLMTLAPFWFAFCNAASDLPKKIIFQPQSVETLPKGNTTEVDVGFTGLDPGREYQFRVDPVLSSGDISVEPREIFLRLDSPDTVWRSLNLTGNHLGMASVRVSEVSESGSGNESSADLSVGVIRTPKEQRLDKIFAYSVAALVSLTYINMGCTLDLAVIKQTLLRPIGPVIGVICQYLIMPLAGFGLSMALLSDPGLQLGLFLTGCSPGGGASNIWTYVLNGNINLSITMTFVSTMVAFAAVPAWGYGLGRVITADTNIVIPYRNILMLMIGLVVPCGIGILINLYLPKVANVLRRVLKPWSIFLFIFIVAFGVYCNLYIWRLVTWQLALASALLPLLGFLGGAAASLLTGRSLEDAIAVSIETGVQNTGVAIFMLKFSLPEPASDLSIIAPIAVAIMTPLPLFCALIGQKLYACRHRADKLPIKQPPGPGVEDLRNNESSRYLMTNELGSLSP